MLEPMAASAGSTATATAQSLLQSESRPTPCGRKSEGQCRSNRNDSRERKHAPVQSETRGAHRLWHKAFKKPHCGRGERESGNCAQAGKHNAFCQELRD